MRSTNSILFSVLFVLFISALPADKYLHFIDPGCTNDGAGSCNAAEWCKFLRDKKELLNEQGDFFIGRDVLEPKGRDLDLKDAEWKRHDESVLSIQCGTLSCVDNLDLSSEFESPVSGLFYDLIANYPHSGATRGKSRFFHSSAFFFISAFRHHLRSFPKPNF